MSSRPIQRWPADALERAALSTSAWASTGPGGDPVAAASTFVRLGAVLQRAAGERANGLALHHAEVRA